MQLSDRRALLVLGDFVLLCVALGAALWSWTQWDPARFRNDPWWPDPAWILLPLLWIGIGAVTGWYELPAISGVSSMWKEIGLAALLLLLLYALVYFFAPRQSLPRAFVLLYLATGLILLISWRVFYALLFSRARLRRRLLIVGAGAAGATVLDLLQDVGGKMFDPVGFVDDDARKQAIKPSGFPVLGSANNLAEICRAHQVAEVIVAITRDIAPEVLEQVLLVQERGVQVTPMPLLYESLTGRVAIEHVGDNWFVALPLSHPELEVAYSFVKRLFDVTVAAVGVSIFALLIPWLAVAIKIDSRGPVFYRQTRLGRNGRPFSLLKLRTMVPSAEKQGQAVWAAARDPRVTRVGRVLRATMLDEMPQLWHVLKGEMSIVGPRPERPELVEPLEDRIPYYRLRHAVRPGMAGWALLHQGYANSTEDAVAKIEYDLYYIKHQSLWLDLQIILRTIGRGLTFRRSEARVGRSKMTLD